MANYLQGLSAQPQNTGGFNQLPSLSPMGGGNNDEGLLTQLRDIFMGRPELFQALQRFNPQQQQAQGQALQMGLQGLQQTPLDFGPIEHRARSQFAQQTVPSMAERFTSMGDNRLTSGAFASQLGEAGAGLEENLASMRSQYGLQQNQAMQNLMGMGMQQQFEPIHRPATPGFLQQLAPAAGQAALMALL